MIDFIHHHKCLQEKILNGTKLSPKFPQPLIILLFIFSPWPVITALIDYHNKTAYFLQTVNMADDKFIFLSYVT